MVDDCETVEAGVGLGGILELLSLSVEGAVVEGDA